MNNFDIFYTGIQALIYSNYGVNIDSAGIVGLAA